MKKPQLATRNTCTGCMACVDTCPQGVLCAHVAKDGHTYPLLLAENCILCGKCSRVCPIVSGYNYERENGHSQPYAAWANDRPLRMKSSSGGVFAAVATKILQGGGCVVGAATDKLDVKHILIDRPEDLPLLQGSKYQQGEMSGIYRAVEQRLRAGQKVLFSGTGCQVGALLNYLGKDYTGQLFTADLICGGFPSNLPLKSFLKNEPYQIETLTYRDKTEGWYDNQRKRITSSSITVSTQTGQKIKYDTDIVYRVFGNHILNRSSCLNCRFAKLRRQSDITLADYWGDRDYPEQHYDGLSLIVAHSPAGETLLKEADVTSHPTTWSKFLPYNQRMSNGRFRFLRLHPGRAMAPFFFSHCSYATLKQLYAVVPVTWLWLPYRIWHGVVMRLTLLGRSRKLHEVLKNLE